MRHMALDIGGSLIKLAYFSPGDADSDDNAPVDTPVDAADPVDAVDADSDASPPVATGASTSPADSDAAASTSAAAPPGVRVNGGDRGTAAMTGAANGTGLQASRQRGSTGSLAGGMPRGGRLHFVKFETSRVDDAIEFIKKKGLHRVRSRDPCDRKPTVQVRSSVRLAAFSPLSKHRATVLCTSCYARRAQLVNNLQWLPCGLAGSIAIRSYLFASEFFPLHNGARVLECSFPCTHADQSDRRRRIQICRTLQRAAGGHIAKGG